MGQWVWRNILFVIFAVVAAPVEFHVRWNLGVLRHNKTLSTHSLNLWRREHFSITQ